MNMMMDVIKLMHMGNYHKHHFIIHISGSDDEYH